MSRVRFGFKASPIDIEQVENRVRLFEELALDRFLCELYLDYVDITDSGVKKKIADNLSGIGGSYVLHVPVVDHRGRFFDPKGMDPDYIGSLAELSREIGGEALVLHRCWGFDTGTGWEEAAALYHEWIRRIAMRFPSELFIVENFGFVFRKMQDSLLFFSSPIDHWFPAEIGLFRASLNKDGVTNVYPFLDVAHANLTLNLLRAWNSDPEIAGRYVHPSIHGKIRDGSLSFGSIEDCISRALYPYFHISDSFSLPPGTHPRMWEEFFMSEGLVPGEGDINWGQLITTVLATYDDVTLLMETNMKDPRNGVEQKRGIEYIRGIVQEIA